LNPGPCTLRKCSPWYYSSATMWWHVSVIPATQEA
jgi:hypothetical protein